MSDERPRPAFGEYATPEEQRAHIREPLLPPPAPTPMPTYSVAPVAPVKPQAPLWDRVLTFGLLGFGLVNVLMTAGQFFNYQTFMTQYFESFGVSHEIASEPRDATYGIIAALVMIAGYALTVFLIWRRMKMGKRTWWVAILGAVITITASSILLAMGLMNDPAMLELVRILTDGAVPTP